jgi:hypothetical protein
LYGAWTQNQELDILADAYAVTSNEVNLPAQQLLTRVADEDLSTQDVQALSMSTPPKLEPHATKKRHRLPRDKRKRSERNNLTASSPK